MSGIRNKKVFKQRSKVPTTNRLFHIVQINALRNIEIMDRKLLTVEVKLVSLWIAKVFTSKILFVDCKCFAFKNFRVNRSCHFEMQRFFPRETLIIRPKKVFKLARFDCNVLSKIFFQGYRSTLLAFNVLPSILGMTAFMYSGDVVFYKSFLKSSFLFKLLN